LVADDSSEVNLPVDVFRKQNIAGADLGQSRFRRISHEIHSLVLSYCSIGGVALAATMSPRDVHIELNHLLG
jgi:hypothetical protein